MSSSTEASTGARAVVEVARNPNLAPYLVGNLVSTTGTWFHTLAQSILIYRLTESAAILGVAFFAQFFPVLVLAPWAGNVADRFSRRDVIVVTQLAATALSACLTVVAAIGHASAPVVVGFAVGLGTTAAFATPAMMTFVTSLVEPGQLSTALAMQSVTFNVGRVVGPLAAALVIDAAGTTLAFGVNTLSYLGLVAGALLVQPLVPQVRPRHRPGFRESIDLVANDRRLLALLVIIAAINLATDPATTLAPAFVTEILGRDDALTGVLMGAFGIGAVAAAFTVSHRLRGTSTQLMVTLAIGGIGAATFAGSPSLAIAIAALIVMGFGYLATTTGATARLQLSVASEQRGRVMALWSVAFLGIRPIGSLVDGALASWVGIRFAALALALPALFCGAALFVADVRGDRARDQTAETAT